MDGPEHDSLIREDFKSRIVKIVQQTRFKHSPGNSTFDVNEVNRIVNSALQAVAKQIESSSVGKILEVSR